jgi:hypothetical protein
LIINKKVYIFGKKRNIMIVEMTHEQIENCKKLINYLLSDNLKAKFDMRFFSDGELGFFSGGELGFNEHKRMECGTCGCAVGHGPYAGIIKLETEDWVVYSIRVFGIDDKQESNLWKYCFSGLWTKKDNTPQGAAQRLQQVLDNTLPTNWVDLIPTVHKN